VNLVDWALVQDLSATKKLLLVALAWISDDQGVTFKSQKVIGGRIGKDPRWVREHLPALAADGLVTRYRRHRLNGSRTSDLLVLNWPRTEPLDLDAYSGIIGEREVGDLEPSGGNPPGGLPAEIGQPSGGNPPAQSQPVESPANGKKETAREDAFPDELPAHLHDVAVQAGKILKRAALERRQKRVVTRAAVGHAVLTFADRDHVTVARNVEAWVLHGKGATQSCADIVARYRRFLEGAEPMAGPPLPAGAMRHSAAGSSTGSSRLRSMAAELRGEPQ